LKRDSLAKSTAEAAKAKACLYIAQPLRSAHGQCGRQ
jgi:hypothetical protein